MAKTSSKPAAKKAAGKPNGPRAMKYLQTRLTEPSWKELQLLRLERGESMQTLVVEALNALLVKHGRKPVIAGPSEDED